MARQLALFEMEGVTMICPNCEIEMGPTYDPYEYQCSQCGYWYDAWAGEELTADDVPPIAISENQQELPGMAETLVVGEASREWSVRPGWINVYTLNEPTECTVCHQIAAYEKSEAGYPGLYHCTACHAWVDKTSGEAWRYTHHDDSAAPDGGNDGN